MFGFFRIAERQLIKNPQGYFMAIKSYSEKVSQKEACAVKKSWKGIKDKAEKIGKDTFTGLFDKYPDYSKLFKRFGDCPEEILNNDCFIKDHAVKTVLRSFEGAVFKIDEPCELKEYVMGLGAKHQGMCMKPEHFKNAAPFLLAAIERNSCDMDCDLKNAWKKTIELIMYFLGKGLGV